MAAGRERSLAAAQFYWRGQRVGAGMQPGKNAHLQQQRSFVGVGNELVWATSRVQAGMLTQAAHVRAHTVRALHAKRDVVARVQGPLRLAAASHLLVLMDPAPATNQPRASEPGGAKHGLTNTL